MTRRFPFIYFFICSFVPFSFAAEPSLPTDVEILTKENFIGRNYFSVGDALQGSASLLIEKTGFRGTQAIGKLRGTNLNDTVVLMDGVPLNFDYDSAVDLGQIPINIVDRIEITRGGSSLQYTGEAIGGVINIITRRPGQKSLETRLGTHVGRYGSIHSEGQLLLRNYWGDYTYLGSLENSGGFINNEGDSATNHFLNISRGIGTKGFWGAEYYYQQSKLGLPEGAPLAFDQWNGLSEREASDPNKVKHQDYQHGKAYFSWNDFIGGRLNSDFTQSRRDVNIQSIDNGPSLRNQVNRTSTYQINWSRHELELGSDLRQMSRELEPDNNHQVHQEALFVSQKFSKNNWSLSPGLRWDDHSNLGAILLPRFVLLYQPHQKILLSASSQRSFRAPTFDELFVASDTLNNPNLKPEKVWSGDLGVQFNPLSSTEIKLTGFLARSVDVIGADPLTQTWANRGRGKNYGLESELNWEGGKEQKWRHVRLKGNWTVQRSFVSFDGSPANMEAALAPHNLAFGKFDYFLPRKITFTNELRYESAQYELTGHNGLQIPGHTIWNSRFGFKVWDADLYFEVDNVAKAQTAEAFGRYQPADGAALTVLSPQPDRTFWTGITIKFDN